MWSLRSIRCFDIQLASGDGATRSTRPTPEELAVTATAGTLGVQPPNRRAAGLSAVDPRLCYGNCTIASSPVPSGLPNGVGFEV
jgi:hypothetical protein